MSTDETTPNVQPSTLFGARTSGLRARLPRPAASTPAPAQADAETSTPAPATAPLNASPSATSAPRATQGVGPRPRVVHIASTLAEALRLEAARDRNVSFAQIVFQAIEATHDSLEFSNAQGGGLFEPQTTARVRPHLKREQVTLRLTPHNESVLDGIAASHGVSRSDLVETALATHLNVTLSAD